MADALHVGGVVSAQEARLDDGGLLAVQGPGALDARTGVMAGPGATALVTGTGATAPMTVNVAAHHWVTSRGSAGGPYRGTKEASTTVQIAAAPGSGTRIDVVYVKMQDNTSGVLFPDGSVGELYGVLQGTVGAGKPNLATIVGAEELATVAVSAGATATNGAGVVITNTARLTAARGGLIVVRSDAERDAITGYAGLQLLELHTGRVRWHDGTRLRYAGDYVTVADTAGRTALSAYAGLLVFQSDTAQTWVRTAAGAWAYIGGDTGWQNLTPVAPTSASSEGMVYRVINRICYVQVHNQYAGGPYGNGFVFTNLPVGARPSRIMRATAHYWGMQPVEISFGPSGAVAVTNGSTGTPGGLSWVDAFPVG